MTPASIRRAVIALNFFASAWARRTFFALLAGGALLTPSLAAAAGHVVVDAGLDPHGLTASKFLLTSAGIFFFFGLVFGAWKYVCIERSAEAQAPMYVDIAHRAALLYSFACALVAQFSGASAWSNAVNLAAAMVFCRSRKLSGPQPC